jgi:hypothetical protein
MVRRISFAAFVLAFSLPAFADDAADARAIVEKAFKAHGGQKAGAAATVAVKSKGTVFAGGMEIPYSGTTYATRPDKQRVELTMEIMGNSVLFVSVFNGNAGWVKVAQMLLEMSADQVKEAREQLYASRVGELWPLLSDAEYKLSVIGDDKAGDRAVVGVRVAREKHRDIRLYFCKETWLVLRTDTSIVPDGGSEEVEQITLLSDYKDADGVKYPGKVVITRKGEKFLDGEITEFKRLEKPEDSWFQKPE